MTKRMKTVDAVLGDAREKMGVTTSDDRDVIDPTPCGPIEIEIPLTVEGVTCGLELSQAKHQDGDRWLAYWWLSEGYDETRGTVEAFPTRLLAAEAALTELEEAGALVSDLAAFLAAALDGKIPELAETEGDTLPSVDSPLSEGDELGELRDYEVQTYRLAIAVTEAEAVVEQAAWEHKQAKKKLETAQADLHKRVVEQRSLPLFDKEPSPVAQPDPALAEPWRAVTTEDMGLAAGIIESLANADKPIRTAGEIVDWTAELGGQGVANPLCAIQGIGPGKAAAIDDALQAVIEANPPEGEGPLKGGE